MAVESIGITDQTEGVNVACREAVEDDSNKTEIRTIQQVDLVHAKKISIDFSVPDREISMSAQDSEVVTVGGISAAILNAAVLVGDDSLLEVNCRIQPGADADYVVVTPLVLSLTDEPLLLLPSKAFSGIDPSPGNGVIYMVHGGDNYTLCPPLTWWVGQYEKVACLITSSYTYDIALWFNTHSGFPNSTYDMFHESAPNTTGGPTGILADVAVSGCRYTI